jgi:hypothetical protein
MDDKLFINLKILGKIQKNGKISRSLDGIISLERESFYQSIKRRLKNDSRKQSLFEINSIINETIKVMENIVNSKWSDIKYCSSNEYYKNCVNLNLILHELKGAKNGIDNLRFTYKSDINIISQLDILIIKIDSSIKDMNHKLNYFKSFLSVKFQNELEIEKENNLPHYYNKKHHTLSYTETKINETQSVNDTNMNEKNETQSVMNEIEMSDTRSVNEIEDDDMDDDNWNNTF